MRECGTCTKCCEGWLAQDVRGHKMFPGKPCFFLEIGIGKPPGCSDYENRPESPCKTYDCTWLVNENVPDEFKPEKIGTLINFRINTVSTPLGDKDIEYMVLVKAPNDPNPELISWAVTYCYSNGYNLTWEVGDQTYWIGSLEFAEMFNNVR